jgi:hypothetical protein
MIAGIFHQGSGLGNQLHRYVATRVLAEDKGLDFGMMGDFKGVSFINLDRGAAVYDVRWNKKSLLKYFPNGEWNEKKVVENGVDIRGYDPEINFVKDYTVIDGEFQDPRYFEHRLKDIEKWLAVEKIEPDYNRCVIGFRGGEYYSDHDLGLPQSYYMQGIGMMLKIDPSMKFEVHTDDEKKAKLFFPNFPVIHDIAINWRLTRFAKYAIIANSSFYILPRLLSGGITIAPRYWARRNTGVWALPQNYYKQFTYI